MHVRLGAGVAVEILATVAEVRSHIITHITTSAIVCLHNTWAQIFTVTHVPHTPTPVLIQLLTP